MSNNNYAREESLLAHQLIRRWALHDPLFLQSTDYVLFPDAGGARADGGKSSIRPPFETACLTEAAKFTYVTFDDDGSTTAMNVT